MYYSVLTFFTSCYWNWRLQSSMWHIFMWQFCSNQVTTPGFIPPPPRLPIHYSSCVCMLITSPNLLLLFLRLHADRTAKSVIILVVFACWSHRQICSHDELNCYLSFSLVPYSSFMVTSVGRYFFLSSLSPAVNVPHSALPLHHCNHFLFLYIDVKRFSGSTLLIQMMFI